MTPIPKADLPKPNLARTPESDTSQNRTPKSMPVSISYISDGEEASTSSTNDANGASDLVFVDVDKPYVKRKLYVSEIKKQWNLSDLLRELGTREGCVAFAELHGLVSTKKKCSRHRTPMRLTMSTNNNFGSWTCNKKVCRTLTKKSRTKGTFFENIKIDLIHVFYIMYAFSQSWSYEQIIHEDPLKRVKATCLSHATICDWFSYCREVIVLYYLEKQEYSGKIGGPAKVVQINASKFGERKCNKGKHIEGHCVLGMIQDGSEDLRLEVCPDSNLSADTLVHLIQRHVEIGSIIHTDCSEAYDCLSEHGYTHKKVDHSGPNNPFVGLDGTHTQRAKSLWKGVKSFLKKEDNCESLADHAIEFLWRRYTIKYKKDKFMEMVNAVKFVYKINEL